MILRPALPRKATNRCINAGPLTAGGDRKRAILASSDSYGKASGEVTATGDTFSSSTKRQPTGADCYIAISDASTLDCTTRGSQVVPACCSASSMTYSTKCQCVPTQQCNVPAPVSRPMEPEMFWHSTPFLRVQGDLILSILIAGDTV